MRNKKLKITAVVIVVLIIGAFVFIRIKGKSKSNEETSIITPVIGNIKVYISDPGTVLPKNRLEVKRWVGQ